MARIVLLVSLIILTSCSFAKNSAVKAFYKQPQTNIENVKKGSYQLDKSHASIIFKVNHLGYSNYVGRFNDFDANLVFNEKDVSKSKVVVKINAFSTDSNNEKMEEKFDSAEFFNVNNFPFIFFESNKIEKITQKTGKIYGTLTMLGVVKPVVLDAKFNGSGINQITKKQTVGFSAKTVINRSNWGMKAYIPAVADEVAIEIEAEFYK